METKMTGTQKQRRQKRLEKRRIRLASRKEALDKKRRKSAMMRADEFIHGLGIGRNPGYAALHAGEIDGAIRLGKTWLIPRRTYEKMIGGVGVSITTKE
jgi:hypothetical protein